MMLAFIAVIGCGKSATEEESRFLVDRSLSIGDPNQQVQDPNLDDRATIFAEENIDRLLSRTGILLIRAHRVSFAQRVEDLKTILVISNRLMQLQDRLNVDQRLFAIQSKIRSLLQLHATGDRQYREELLEVIDEFSDDSDDDVRRVSLTALAAVRMSDFLRTGNGSFEKLEVLVTRIVSEFPDDEIAAGELQDIAFQLMLRNKRQQAIGIMQKMSDVYACSANPELNHLATVLRDRVGMAEGQLQDLANELLSDDSCHCETVLDVVRKLSNMRDIDFDTYRELMTAIGWLEEVDLYDEAKMSLANISRNAPGYSNPQLVEQAEIDVQKGIGRLNLLNQKLTVSGQNADGLRVTTDQFDNPILVLFFWSADYSQSLQGFEQFMGVREKFGQSVQCIGVCVDREVDQAKAMFGAENRGWKNIYRTTNQDDEASIKSTRVQFVPYVMLLDQQHRVRDINVRARDLIDNVETLLGEQHRLDQTAGTR